MSGRMLRRILVDLLTLYSTVYMVKYVYDQTFEILLVKFWDFLAILTKFISKFEFVGMNIKTDSKRAFYALSNGILNIYVYDQIFEISLVKVWRKMGI